MDSNHRRQRQRVYSPSPLATRATPLETLFFQHGAGEGTRTRNLRITSALLYQLSYASLVPVPGEHHGEKDNTLF